MSPKQNLPSRAKELAKQFNDFMRGPLWFLNLEQEAGLKRFLYYQLRIIYIVARGFGKSKLPLRASALTYTAIFSIVPMLAVVFSIFHALGGTSSITEHIEPFILENLAAGSQETVHEYLGKFVGNINAGALGGIGAGVLVVTVISLMTNIEKAFNEIWGIHRVRPFFLRSAIYFTLVATMPVFLGLSLSMTAMIKSNNFVTWLAEAAPYGHDMIQFAFKSLPILFTWLTFTALYAVMPNTHVKLRSAVIGGVIGGSIWEIAKVVYTIWQIKSSNYSAIYGSLAAIPFFLIWIYISWVVVLLGAQITYANENAASYEWEEALGITNFKLRRLIGIWMMLHICGRFEKGLQPFSIDLVKKYSYVPFRLANDILYELLTEGLIIEVSGSSGEGGYVPAKPLERLSLVDIVLALERQGKDKLDFKPDHISDDAKKIVSEIEGILKSSGSLNRSMRDVCATLNYSA